MGDDMNEKIQRKHYILNDDKGASLKFLPSAKDVKSSI